MCQSKAEGIFSSEKMLHNVAQSWHYWLVNTKQNSSVFPFVIRYFPLKNKSKQFDLSNIVVSRLSTLIYLKVPFSEQICLHLQT